MPARSEPFAAARETEGQDLTTQDRRKAASCKDIPDIHDWDRAI